jgi:hypothetical protein
MTEALERFRVFMRDYDGGTYAGALGLSDDDLREALDGADRWIGGRRWSRFVVAANWLRDGEWHA